MFKSPSVERFWTEVSGLIYIFALIAGMSDMFYIGGMFDPIVHFPGENLVLIIFYYLFLVPAIIIHELGHAIAFQLTGAELLKIQLGSRFPLTGKHWKFRFLGYNWEIYGYPMTGLTRATLTFSDRYRLRFGICMGTGPLASLVASLFGYLIALLFTEQYLAERWIAGIAAAFGLANLGIFIGTILPSRSTKNGRKILEVTAIK